MLDEKQAIILGIAVYRNGEFINDVNDCWILTASTAIFRVPGTVEVE
jgi:hypothetical protein